ncbi:MAG: hypothetical protein J5825_05430, partial [Lachnospiraceae bacterium]|nr:hypothetical protein [Lachnospiraceae bacterium]
MINRTSEEIFTISSDNLTEMILEYFESVSGPGSLLDHLGDYREYCVSDEAVLSGHPEIAEMITRDRFGEEIGTSFRGILDVEKLCSRSEKETDTLYFDREDRLAAYRKLTDPERPDRMYDAEVFEYAGDLRYSKSSGCITCGEENYGFSFFRYSKGAVAEFLKVIGNFGGYGNEDPFELKLPSELKVNHYVFDDTPEHKPVRMDHYELSYTKTTGRYMIVRSFDRLNPPPKKAPVKRVIDSQKKLCASLTKKIPEKTTLAQATELFFEVIGGA